MLNPVIKKNDKKAGWIIGIFSALLFLIIVSLSRIQLQVSPGFDVHIFAAINALLNSTVALLLIAAFVAVKQKRYLLHKRLMMFALVCSVLFLLSYITHHLLAGDTRFGDVNLDGVVDAAEKQAVGSMRYLYLFLLLSHIFLAAIILPFILFTAYRALTAEFPRHKKLARITWPLWLYVAISGPLLYWMISPYYQ